MLRSLPLATGRADRPVPSDDRAVEFLGREVLEALSALQPRATTAAIGAALELRVRLIRSALGCDRCSLSA